MTDDEITAIWNSMPGGHAGFYKEWGYQQFARKLIEKVDRPTPDLQPLKVELQWCIDHA